MSAEWQGACAELEAALAACERRDCGISADAAQMVDVVARDESLGPVSVRHVARVIRQGTAAMVRQARQVEAARVEFWASRGEPEQASATPWGG